MKKFISGLFKKKNSDSGVTPPSDADMPVPKAKAAPAQLPPKAGAPSAEAAPQAEPKPTASPVLKSLYGGQEETMTAAPEPQLPPYQHLPFEGELQAVIQTLVDDLGDVYPQTFEQWEDGFRRDENPEQEIAAWTHVAAVLKAMSIQFSFALPEKRECFNILIACFTGSRESVRTRAQSKLLSADQTEQAIRYFYEGGY